MGRKRWHQTRSRDGNASDFAASSVRRVLTKSERKALRRAEQEKAKSLIEEAAKPPRDMSASVILSSERLLEYYEDNNYGEYDIDIRI